jgi:hypothetical protein
MSLSFFNTNDPGLNINVNSIKLIGTTGTGIIHNDSSGKLFSALIQGSDIGYQTITSDKLSPEIVLVGSTGAQGLQGTQGLQGSLGKGFKVFMSGITIDNTVTSAFYDGGSGTHVGEFFLMTGGNIYCYIPGTLADSGTGDYVDFKFSGDVTNESVLKGEQGQTGAQGTTGTQGIQGLQGLQGTTGIQGTQGLHGTTGTQGLQGLQGTTGIQGLQGTTGTQGSTGTQGIQGTTGIKGEQGSTGAQGIKGDQGIGSTGIIITNNNNNTTSYLVLTNGTSSTDYQSLSADAITGPLSYQPSSGVLSVSALSVGSVWTWKSFEFTGTLGTNRQIINASKITLKDETDATANTSTIAQNGINLNLAPVTGVTGGTIYLYATNNVGTQKHGLSVHCNSGAEASVSMQNAYTLNDSINGGQIFQNVNGSQGLCRNVNALTLGKTGTSGTITQWEERGPTGVNQVTFSSTSAIVNFRVPVTVGANNLKCSYAPSAADDVANKLYCDTAVAALVAAAPATLNTLNELAVALGNDANYATTTTTLIGTKASLAEPQTISGVNTFSNTSNIYYGSGANLSNINSTKAAITLTNFGIDQVVPLVNTQTATAGDYAFNIGLAYSNNIRFNNSTGAMTVNKYYGDGSSLSGVMKTNTTQTISGVNTFSNTSNIFYGSGANLTGVNTSTITTTTIPTTGLYYIPVTSSSTGTSGLTPYASSLSFSTGANRVTIPNLSTTGEISINSTFNSFTPTTTTPTLTIKNFNSNQTLQFFPNITGGGWNSMNVGGDNSIVAVGTVNTNSLTLTTWSNTSSGVRVSANAVLLGAGGNLNVPTTNLSINGAAGTLSLTANSVAAISINSTGIATFSVPPLCSVAPTTANMLCNKTYVDAQNSSSKIVIGTAITNATTGDLSTGTLAGFYTYTATSAYNITLPIPSAGIAGTYIMFRGIGTGTSAITLKTVTGSYMVSAIGPTAEPGLTISAGSVSSSNKVILGSYLCDGLLWYQTARDH